MTSCCVCNAPVCQCGGFTHPTVIFNPPGLEIITYRAGDFAAFRRALLQSLPGETELSSTQGGITTPIWQPSGHGDLALQMMEWWAYLADVLTFYNQRIANQSYLGTADLAVSVNRLIRLLGYRPRPGIGATGTVAALANTPLPFTLPKGFAIQSKPGPGEQPQVFELSAATSVGMTPTGPVSPAQMLGAAPTQTQTLSQAKTNVSLTSTNPTTLTLAGTSSAVKKGDAVLVAPPARLTTTGPFGLATVETVTHTTDPTLGPITNIAIEWTPPTPVSPGSATQWQLYKGGQVTQVWQYPADHDLVVRLTTTNPPQMIVDLPSLVRVIKAGDPIIFFDGGGAPPTFYAGTVLSVTEVVWYANPKNYTPGGGVAGVDPSQPPPSSGSGAEIAIPIPHTSVTFSWDSTISAPDDTYMTSRTQFAVWYGWTELDDLIAIPSSPTVGGSTSSSESASSPVVLQLPDNTNVPPPSEPAGTAVLVVDSVGTGASGYADPSTASAAAPTVTLSPPVPLLIPPLQTYFNLLPVTRGKTVSNEVLGSGAATLAGQDFTLKNAPVTYLQDAASESGYDYSSTVDVWVNGVQWQEVQSFYGQDIAAQVFVTSEDDSGNTHVSFGDGVHGARLPTGTNNVTASYRYGSGAASPQAGTLTVVLKPQPGLRSIVNPVAVGGGSDPDSPGKIRQLAPQSVLTLGRAVSADDFQVIAAQAPGVTRAAAAFAFDPIEQRPRVTVWVGDDQNAVDSATNAIAAAADPNRLPSVTAATQIAIALALSISVDPKYQPANVQAALYTALLDPDHGLFGVNAVGIGQVFFNSGIYAACLAVPGVTAVHKLRLSIKEGRFNHYVIKGGKRGAPARPAAADCGHTRHDPGAGNYYFLADDGTSLAISVEAS